MKEYIYYTPIDLARNILNNMPEIEIESIIDICCGSWNLLQAGKEKYPNAVITGIDIDKEAEKHKFIEANFQIMDGREFAKNEYKRGNTYDLILSNPPFGRILENERKYKMEDELMDVYYPQLLNSRYECEMMQANMLLAHEGSILLFILPYTFIAGESFQRARCQIAKDYSVLSIVKLPITTFEKGKINTFAVVLQKEGPRHQTMIYNAICDDGWKIDKMKEIDEIDVRNGNWWFTKKSIDTDKIKIFRGNVSSGTFKEKGQVVLHCAAKKTGKWVPSVRYYDSAALKKDTVKAKKGDILINRIGRDAGYWNINEIDDISISDCLLVLPNITQKMLKILEKNSDNGGRLKIPRRGITTSYVTAEDVKVLFWDEGEEISVG